MQQSSQYSLIDIDMKRNTSRLVHSELGVFEETEGTSIEAQFLLSDRRNLIWIGDSSPYDAFIRILLLDPHGKLLDAIEGGAALADGILKIVSTGENSVDFEYYQNEIVYRLEVASGRSFRLPLPWGWRYRNFGWGHQLTIRQIEARKPS